MQDQDLVVLVDHRGGQLHVRQGRSHGQDTGVRQAALVAQALDVHVQPPHVPALGNAQVFPPHHPAPQKQALHKGLEGLALLLLRLDGRVLGVAQGGQVHFHAHFPLGGRVLRRLPHLQGDARHDLGAPNLHQRRPRRAPLQDAPQEGQVAEAGEGPAVQAGPRLDQPLKRAGRVQLGVYKGLVHDGGRCCVCVGCGLVGLEGYVVAARSPPLVPLWAHLLPHFSLATTALPTHSPTHPQDVSFCLHPSPAASPFLLRLAFWQCLVNLLSLLARLRFVLCGHS